MEVGDVVTLDRAFPTATYIVPTGQELGRLVTHMLEVETEDNVVYWNTMDRWILENGARDERRGPKLLPIFKLMAPTPLPARILGSAP